MKKLILAFDVPGRMNDGKHWWDPHILITGPITILAQLIAVLVVIIVIGGVVLFLEEDEPEDLKMTTSCYQTDREDFVVEVVKINFPVRLMHMNFIVLNEHGGGIQGEQGSVWDIYGRDLAFGSSMMESINIERRNVSFIDADRSGWISTGDYFIVRSETNGGIADEQCGLLLKLDGTGRKLGQCTFSGLETKSYDYPTSIFTEIPTVDKNLTLIENQGIMSREGATNRHRIQVIAAFSFQGSNDTNISGEWFIGNRSIGQKEEVVEVTSGEEVYYAEDFHCAMNRVDTHMEVQHLTLIVRESDSGTILFEGSCSYFGHNPVF